jgi:murein DD-endopeptidase MepM/ murein hydrolase activator NlpD
MVRRRGYGLIAWAVQRLVLALLASCVLTWLYLQLDRRTLPGIRVGGETLPRTGDPAHALAARAQAWMAAKVDIHTPPHLTRATRGELGASIDTAALARRLQELGRSGNPFLDLATFASALFSGRDVAWTPSVNRLVLGRYLQAIRRNVERLPVAGATDEQGWSIAGVPGITLDVVPASLLVEKALRSGGRSVEIALREVPPPAPLAIGSPDAVLYDDDPGQEQLSPDEMLDPAEVSALLAAARPRDWLPSRGDECDIGMPGEHFCQGPRRVPRPFGPADDLARALGLGLVETVGQLLMRGATREWTDNAGRPPPDGKLLWPVPGGHLWRGFGYVRKPPYENKLHRGIDIGAPRGTPIVAINDGIVAYSDNRVRGYGNLLVIIHGDGSMSMSAHCTAVYLFPGQKVKRGQIVGEVGDTGFARGTHVHFEYHLRGEPHDPYPLFIHPKSRIGG